MEEDNLRDSDPTPVRGHTAIPASSVGWERVKDAFRRDWVRTMTDPAGKGPVSPNPSAIDATPAADHDLLDLQEAISMIDATTGDAESAWAQAEREARFGFDVRLEHPDVSWGDAMDQSMRARWESTGDPRPWSEARAGVRRGWDIGHRGR